MTKISVVGSGVIGLASALELSLKGFKTRVITKDLYDAASWVAGGMLAPFSEGLKDDIFEFSYESLKLYSGFVKRIEDVSNQKIDIWKDGINRVVFRGEEDLLCKAEEYSRSYEVEIYKDPKNAVPQISDNVEAVIHYQEEGWVDTYSLMNALIKSLERLDVEIVQDSILKVNLQDERVEKLIGVKDEYYSDFYVFCLGAWIRQLFDVPVYPIKGQAITVNTRVSERVLYSNVSYIIPRRAYTYVGATSEEKDFSRKATVFGILSLSKGLMDVLPSSGPTEFLDALVSFRPCTADQLPVFQIGKNYVLAGGHCRNGILHAPITSKLISEYIDKGSVSRYMEIFSARRLRV